jgi:hypothetical protein
MTFQRTPGQQLLTITLKKVMCAIVQCAHYMLQTTRSFVSRVEIAEIQTVPELADQTGVRFPW